MINIKTFNNSRYIVITGIPNPFHNFHMVSTYGKFNGHIMSLLMDDVKKGSMMCYDSIYELYDLIYQQNSIIIPINPFNKSISTFKCKFKTLFYVYPGDLHRKNLHYSIKVLFDEPFKE